jgi:hypothetical protein
MWLLGVTEVAYWKNNIESIPYQHYGKERLIAICNRYGIAWKQLDDGQRVDT